MLSSATPGYRARPSVPHKCAWSRPIELLMGLASS